MELLKAIEIWCNKIADIEKTLSGIVVEDISDHLPVFYIQNIKPKSKTNLETMLVRQEHSANIHKLFEELCNFNWDYITCVSDVNEAFNKFHDAYISIYNSC